MTSCLKAINWLAFSWPVHAKPRLFPIRYLDRPSDNLSLKHMAKIEARQALSNNRII
jgi:hypothetical protein